MITLATYQNRMCEDMQLRQLRPKTQDAYRRAVRQFFEHVSKEPLALSEADVRDYLLYLQDERMLAPSTRNVAVHGLRFFFTYTFPQEWTVMDFVRVKIPQKLPPVLSREETLRVLAAVREPTRRMALQTIYALGLRLNEALRLEVRDIDSDRLLVSIRDAKGAKDRMVPLPRPLLHRLRTYWKQERRASARPLVFVGEAHGGTVHPTTLQKTFRAVLEQERVEKRASIHTLRHSYATHLLEAGITLKTIQRILGHRSLKTTTVYLHITHENDEKLLTTLDRLMAKI